MLTTIAMLWLSFLLMQTPGQPNTNNASAASQLGTAERLGENLFRIGNIRIDTASRELSVPGVVNEVSVLEFVANTKGGFKAYESAITVESDAITFNLALLLIGVDKSNSVAPRKHFDLNPPKGDPLEIWVEWQNGAIAKRERVEEIVYDKQKQRTLPHGPWVYTGSLFMPDGRYLADVDGVLIGFVHTPASIVEYQQPDGVASWGTFITNPTIDLKPDTPIKLIVRSLSKTARD